MQFLVFGGSGLVGRRLARRLGPERCVATYRGHPFPDAVRFDASTMGIDDLGIDLSATTHAFLLFGHADIDGCARDPASSHRINVEAVVRLARALADRGIVPVFASSDAVFDGGRGLYREDDPPAPITTYGRQKLEAEQALLALGRPVLIVRLSKVVGGEPVTHGLFAEWIEALARGETVRCARDQVFSPIALDDAASCLIGLADCGARGIFHVAGPRPYSRLALFRLARKAARAYLPEAADAVACSIRDLPFAEPRPLDTSLAIDKLVRTIEPRFEAMPETARRAAAAFFATRSGRLRGAGSAD